MRDHCITFRSVTYAQKGENTVQRAGIACVMQRTPRWMEEQGCGYALRVWTEDIRPAVKLLRQERVMMKRLYIQGSNGQLEEMPL